MIGRELIGPAWYSFLLATGRQTVYKGENIMFYFG